MTVETASVIKPGDVFEIRYEVKELTPDGLGALCLRLDGAHTYHDLRVLLAGRRVERPLAIGDRVKCGGYGYGTLQAIQGQYAWVWAEQSKVPMTIELSELERATMETRQP